MGPMRGHSHRCTWAVRAWIARFVAKNGSGSRCPRTRSGSRWPWCGWVTSRARSRSPSISLRSVCSSTGASSRPLVPSRFPMTRMPRVCLPGCASAVRGLSSSGETRDALFMRALAIWRSMRRSTSPTRRLPSRRSRGSRRPSRPRRRSVRSPRSAAVSSREDVGSRSMAPTADTTTRTASCHGRG